MEEIVYQALSDYYDTLGYTGYMPDEQGQKLLILSFYKDFVFKDYRGLLTEEDYSYIEQALDCLYGTTCLIPYPDYLKMGKLNLGEMTELAQRVKVLEDTDVLKLVKNPEEDVDTDVIIVEEED